MCFTQFEAARDDWIGLVRFCSIILVQLVRKSNSQQNRCSIAQPNRTIGVRLGSIGFLFGFVRLDRSGEVHVDTTAVNPPLSPLEGSFISNSLLEGGLIDMAG